MDIEHVFQTRSILQVSTLKSEALSAGEIILTTRYAMVLKDVARMSLDCVEGNVIFS